MARGTNLLLALGADAAGYVCVPDSFLARPHVLSWLFTLAWFWILDSSERSGLQGGRVGWLWALPLSMLLWANVHGGFVLGFVLLGSYWLASLWAWVTTRETRLEDSLEKIASGHRVRQLTVLGLLAIAASFVNPYGWKLHAHIYEYLSNRFLMDHIEEFQSPNFHGVAQRCFLVLLLITVAVLTVRGRKLRLSEILLVLFAVYSGLYASRNIPVSSILLVLIIGPLLPAFHSRRFAERMGAVDSRLRGHLWPVLAVAAALLIAGNGGRVGSVLWMDAHFDPVRMPVGAVNYLEQNGLKSAVFSPDYWGGYLIYRLYPRNLVVIDDRHDFYGESYLRLYLEFIHVEAGWNQFLKVHDLTCMVLPRNAALAVLLSETPGWKAVYSDNVAIVFTRIDQKVEDTDRDPGQ